jgi:hypothetical protein
MGRMTSCGDCGFAVGSAPGDEVVAGELHGYVGLSNKALDGAEVDGTLNLDLGEQAHYMFMYA